MTAQFVALCIDANDPSNLARFWAKALRWEVDEETSDEFVRLVPTDGTTFGIALRHAPEPKAGRNRMHLDVTTTSVDDQQQSVSRLLEAGGRHIDIGQRPEEPHVVLADPEGNEFCVFEPQALEPDSFYAGCGRLGTLNCLGSREVGQFWSTALGWPLVWDQNGETAIRESEDAGAYITFTPALPTTKRDRLHRLHFHIAACDKHDRRAEIERLLTLGAAHLDIGRDDADWTVMADQDGNEFCVLPTQ